MKENHKFLLSESIFFPPMELVSSSVLGEVELEKKKKKEEEVAAFIFVIVREETWRTP